MIGEAKGAHLPLSLGDEALIELLPFPVAIANMDRTRSWISTASDSFLTALCLPRIGVIGHPLHKIFKPETAAIINAALRKACEGVEPVRARLVHRHPDGHEFRLGLMLHCLPDNDAQRVLMALDPTRDRAPAARPEAIFNQLGPLGNGIIYIHERLRERWRYVEHPLVDALGLPEDHLTYPDLLDRIHPDDHAALREHLDSQHGRGEASVGQVTLRMRDRDGGWRWMHARERVLGRGRDGVVTRMIGVAADITEERRNAEVVSDLTSALAKAEENERRRIGRELHDSTAQLLVGMDLSLSALQRRMTPNLEQGAIVAELRTTLASAQREIRNFAYMLHPPSLLKAGLGAALQEFGIGFARRTGLQISVQVDDDLPDPGVWAGAALFRVAQEGLMNVFRHAHATTAIVSLYVKDDMLVLEVEDNGVGLDLDRVEECAGVGITGMRARMVQLGGVLTFERRSRGLLVRGAAPLGSSPTSPLPADAKRD